MPTARGMGGGSGDAYAHEIAVLDIDAEQRAGTAVALRRVAGADVAQSEPGLHAARGPAARAHRLDDGRGAGHDVAAGVDAGDRSGEVRIGGDVPAGVELQRRRL